MAKLKYDANMGDNHISEIGGNYFPDPDLALTGPHNKTTATYVNTTNDFSIDFVGTDFKYKDGELIKGTLTKVTFRDDDGDKLATISDFKKNIASLMEPLKTEVSDFLQELFRHADTMIGSSAGEQIIGESGNDIIIGRGGRDLIFGNDGNDTMAGGAGNDDFFFFGGAGGKDVITDFNIGDEENFDLIFIRDTGFTEVENANDFLKLVFEDGSSVLLKGVLFADRADVHFDVI
jgi:Ca2+-binding RTX toxin-like protein